ncbi:UPF0481 protein [Camellia lanceoleosa]|uniref:UPF0481 protein n=1 Tax=Camellia lanceoleosa TaxID=1840588 RepID=A0ACC0GDB9_9ERIC|nr:UPF0481 protein [Camellia lanceoleosa]
MLWRKNETKKYYQPYLVSIGPYYRNNINLKSFEKFKIQFTREFVKSCDPPDITELYNKVAEVAGEARSCYAESTTKEIDDITFTEMMFLDDCFILQFIRCIVKTEKGQMEMMMSHDIAKVKRDLFLLGNQLPLIVLRALTMATKSALFDGTKGSYSIPIFIKKIRETRYSNIPLVEPEHYNNHLLQYMWEDYVDHCYISSRNWGKQDNGSNCHKPRVIQPWTLRWWGSNSGLPIVMTYHT